MNFRKCPGWYEISTVFYRKALHRRRMEILADPNIFFHPKHQITPAKFSISKTKFWNLFYIIRKRPPDRDKPLRTLFSSSEMSKISKKLVFFQPKPRFRMVFHGFPCQNFIHCSRHAYPGGTVQGFSRISVNKTVNHPKPNRIHLQ